MSQWFETKVKYDKTMLDTGAIKSVTEPYLVDALSFTEAEARITKEMEPFVKCASKMCFTTKAATAGTK